MLNFIGNSWALLLGILLLMVGNGLQGTLLGLRGAIEGFSTLQMSVVMAAYFAGFLGGSRLAPQMICRVGHVRVFAALGTLISAVLILFPVFANPWVWSAGRLIIGFCFSGVYVTAESWLNERATNETRGQVLSVYLIVQMAGLVAGQVLLVLGEPAGFVLFIISSVLVSIAFTPILLSATPTPGFSAARAMTLSRLYEISPLGVVGAFLFGGAFAAQFGMAAVFASSIELNVAQTSLFVATFYVGGLLFQFPVGWLSDRMDRRFLIAVAGLTGAAFSLLASFMLSNFPMLIIAALFVGGTTNPLYALLIAHTNDFLEHDEMPAASGGLVFLTGTGAIIGPLIMGLALDLSGPMGFFMFMFVALGGLACHAIYRTTQRSAPTIEEAGSCAPIIPSATPVMLEAAQEVAIDAAQAEPEEAPKDANLP